eukprot:44246-Rhodomonas_salina.2
MGGGVEGRVEGNEEEVARSDAVSPYALPTPSPRTEEELARSEPLSPYAISGTHTAYLPTMPLRHVVYAHTVSPTVSLRHVRYPQTVSPTISLRHVRYSHSVSRYQTPRQSWAPDRR